MLAGVKGGPVSIATLSGRYYAMDRDKRWDRVTLAYQAIVEGRGVTAADPVGAVQASYQAGKNDEFVLPTVIGGYSGMKDGDGLIMANFRADRAREILSVLVDPAFDGFPRPRLPNFVTRLGMSEYSSDLNRFFEVLFPAESLTRIFGEVISDAGLTQLRIAETEKYAHVTFFFNGGREAVFPGEQRILVPSPKVATYDLKPEMSAPEVTDKLVAAIEGRHFRRYRGQLRQLAIWSAIPAFWRRPSRPWKPSTAVSAACGPRWRGPAAACWSPPTTEMPN